MLQRKPRAGGSFDAGRLSMRLREDKRPEHKICAYRTVTVNRHKGRGRGNGRRYLEFRLRVTFAWFRYSRRFFSSATPSAWSFRARHSRSRVGSKPYLRFASVPIRV
jgi:hypothetical protein